MFKNALPLFLTIAFLEGCSYLAFAITMPIKYMLGMPGPNYVVGMAHGILFLSYVVLLVLVVIQRKWSYLKAFLSLLASLIPFGTFYAKNNLYPKNI